MPAILADDDAARTPQLAELVGVDDRVALPLADRRGAAQALGDRAGERRLGLGPRLLAEQVWTAASRHAEGYAQTE